MQSFGNLLSFCSGAISAPGSCIILSHSRRVSSRPPSLLARLAAHAHKSTLKFDKTMKKFLVALGFAPVAVLADGYTVPTGVTTAITNAEAAAEGLANAAIPGVASIALACVGIAVIWLLVKSIRRAMR